MAYHLHNRQSIRLQGYDYSQPGKYFITICIQNSFLDLFGSVNESKMILNNLGMIAHKCWLEIPMHYPNIMLDEFIVMPNHVHGILEIQKKNKSGVLDKAQEYHNVNEYQKIIPRSIGAIIRGYKIGVTKWARQNTDMNIVWQRNFHEYVIRDEKAYLNIKTYIKNNPQKWFEDRFCNQISNSVKEEFVIYAGEEWKEFV